MRPGSNVILEKTVEFSLLVIEYVELLVEKKKFVVANQLLKSATSIGANVHEAQDAESLNDFIHKFKLAAKEVNETSYWLVLCKHSATYPDCNDIEEKLEELSRIINKIISTTKSRKFTN